MDGIEKLGDEHLSGAGERFGRQRGSDGVNGRIGKPRELEGFTALDASAASAAVDVAALVAGPGLSEVHAKFMPAPRDLGLGVVDEGAENLDGGIRAEANRVPHGFHEILTAVRINGVVARMGRDHQAVGLDGFGVAAGDGEHDAVAEGHDGLLHRLLFVVPVGNRAAGLQQVRLEKLVNEFEPDGAMRDFEFLAMPGGKGNFLVIVLRAVVEAHRSDDGIFLMGFVEGGH